MAVKIRALIKELAVNETVFGSGFFKKDLNGKWWRVTSKDISIIVEVYVLDETRYPQILFKLVS